MKKRIFLLTSSIIVVSLIICGYTTTNKTQKVQNKNVSVIKVKAQTSNQQVFQDCKKMSEILIRVTNSGVYVMTAEEKTFQKSFEAKYINISNEKFLQFSEDERLEIIRNKEALLDYLFPEFCTQNGEANWQSNINEINKYHKSQILKECNDCIKDVDKMLK